ncbi:HAMP domain-containing sensor histidine kinase [Variovorax sp. J31P179]|uniref:sensor histidine kinase n=1 Tax=Variovorax sp. J31P179 TaxID=3053508 RepID=UPI00257657B7|nr:HAMP domain-containing sensor histidine kinase [Variovorax sp. J31P179]MDM0085545.1 HAMP domain-containing sensor histidine kinase [Variovorax sp. J31P179]
MQISDFIERAREEILAESVAHAKTIFALGDEGEVVLRDHLPKLLEAISADLRTPQSRTESIERSRGRAPWGHPSEATAAATHGLLRARSGLHVEQLVAEFRALRSCVLRLWAEASVADADSIRDIGRFNEAIDQALAESVREYAAEVERWQQIFLGVLGHDLRGPLNAVSLTAQVMARRAPKAMSASAAALTRGTHRMAVLLDSLLEYNRAGLGAGMAIELAPGDLAAACEEELELQRAALPGARIEWVVQGDTRLQFDSSRMCEALGNLVANAVKHGLPSEPVTVQLEGDDDVVRLSVENAIGRHLSRGEIERLFEPLRRGTKEAPRTDRSHLGLGLFIARQIARAHGGDVIGQSTSQRICFTMTVPRSVPAKAW